MDLWKRSALLLLLSACATSEPSLKDQAAVPLGPFAVPKPMATPAPVGLTPAAPLVVVPEEQPDPRQKSSSDKEPAPAVTTERRLECEPILKPHRGGDALHNQCADNVPLNDARGFDALVNGKRPGDRVAARARACRGLRIWFFGRRPQRGASSRTAQKGSHPEGRHHGLVLT